MMTIKNRKSIDFLTESHTLGLQAILERVAQIKALDEVIKTLLDEKLRHHCTVINYRGHRVIIAVDNAAFGTLLRFQLPELLSTLRQNPAFASVAGLDYYVRPTVPLASPALTEIREISTKTAQNIDAAAAHITDPVLKAALLKFKQYQKKSIKTSQIRGFE